MAKPTAAAQPLDPELVSQASRLSGIQHPQNEQVFGTVRNPNPLRNPHPPSNLEPGKVPLPKKSGSSSSHAPKSFEDRVKERMAQKDSGRRDVGADDEDDEDDDDDDDDGSGDEDDEDGSDDNDGSPEADNPFGADREDLAAKYTAKLTPEELEKQKMFYVAQIFVFQQRGKKLPKERYTMEDSLPVLQMAYEMCMIDEDCDIYVRNAKKKVRLFHTAVMAANAHFGPVLQPERVNPKLNQLLTEEEGTFRRMHSMYSRRGHNSNPTSQLLQSLALLYLDEASQTMQNGNAGGYGSALAGRMGFGGGAGRAPVASSAPAPPPSAGGMNAAMRQQASRAGHAGLGGLGLGEPTSGIGSGRTAAAATLNPNMPMNTGKMPSPFDERMF